MQHIGIKNTFRTLLAGLILLAGASAAQAAQIDGSIALSVDSTSLNGASTVAAATSFTFAGINTDKSGDGDFTNTPSGLLVAAGPVTLTVSPTSFSFGSLSSFGTFTGTSILFDDLGNNARFITLSGTFTGGALFPGLNTATDAMLVVGLTQAGGAGRPVSASFTLVTVPTVVPEPASMAMLGLGLVGVLGAARLRRKAV